MTPDAPARVGVLCAGSVMVDVSKVVDVFPVPEHLATIEQVSSSTGGPALNMAVDLRMLGAAFPIGLSGAVGDDAHGDLILAECARLTIDTSGVRQLSDVPTSFTDAMVERVGGRRTYFHHPGANARFDGAHVVLDSSSARILHVGAPGLHAEMDETRTADGSNGWTELLGRARALGLQTNLELASLSADRSVDIAAPCLPHTDSVIINEFEAGALTGLTAVHVGPHAPVDWSLPEQMARGLIDRGVRHLAVVHFPGGCVAADASGRTWRQGSVRVRREEVRSTTGAGDALAAGVLLGVHDGWPMERSLRLGVAAAAACIRSPLTSAGITVAQKCLADADRRGYH